MPDNRSVPETILILGGTREAADLARELVDSHPAARIITSLAGRTKEPAPLAGEIRTGGFGGIQGLARYLHETGVTCLIDATHPFARQISANAIEAAEIASVPLDIRTRTPWAKQPDDNWIEVETLEAARDAIPPRARVLLALGSQHISLFATRHDVHFVVRMIDPPDTPLELPDHALVLGRPGDTAAVETMLLIAHAITHIVCRNSGGKAAYAKIEAARRLALPVIMVGRGDTAVQRADYRSAMKKPLDTVFDFQKKHFKEIVTIGISEAVSLSGIPLVGTAAGLVVKFALRLLGDTAEIKVPVLQPGKHGEFISEDVFYLESVYTHEKPVWCGIPYLELHNFIAEIIATDRANIRIRPSRSFFEISPFKEPLLEELRDTAEAAFRNQRRMTHDSNVIRLNGFSKEDGALVLDISKTTFLRQVRSNLVLDFSATPQTPSLRQALSQENFGYLPKLSDKRLANTIGLAVLVFYKDNGRLTPFFVPRTREVAIFNKGEWHCTASGAAEWPEDPEQTPETFEAYILDDLFDELREEVGLRREDLTNVLPLALCREFARGGKPQLFFIGFTDLSHAELVERMERARKTTLPRTEPTEVYRMPFFRFPAQFADAESIARSFEGSGFTSEGAANLYYAVRFLQAAEKDTV